jgi:hypothetical protein
MIAAEHVAELVLIPEFHIPVGVPEKPIGPFARPPRLLEIVIQVGVAADERGCNTGANGLQLAPVDRTPVAGLRRIGLLLRRRAIRPGGGQRENQDTLYEAQYFSAVRRR